MAFRQESATLLNSSILNKPAFLSTILVSPLDYWLMSSRQPDLHPVTPRWICGSGKAPHLLELVSAFLINKPFLFPNSDVLSFGPLKC